MRLEIDDGDGDGDDDKSSDRHITLSVIPPNVTQLATG